MRWKELRCDSTFVCYVTYVTLEQDEIECIGIEISPWIIFVRYLAISLDARFVNRISLSRAFSI